MNRATRIAPWIAVALPPCAWFGFEVGLASALRLSCATVGAGLGFAWGVASLAVCAYAAWLARPVAMRGDPSSSWLARVASIGSVVFAVAILFQTIGTLIVPSCAR